VDQELYLKIQQMIIHGITRLMKTRYRFDEYTAVEEKEMV